MIAYLRTGEEQTILVAANFNLDEREVALPGASSGALSETLLVNEGEASADGGVLRLRGIQAAVILLK